MSDDTAAEVLARGLYQLETLLGSISQGDLGRPTPCSDWSLADLVDHVVQAPAKFARMVPGEPVDWSAPTHHEDDLVAAYRRHADELRAALPATLTFSRAPTGSAQRSRCTRGTSPQRSAEANFSGDGR